MKQKTTTYTAVQQVTDTHPIRATCFHPSGEAYVVGTNSKALKICKYPSLERRLELLNDDSCPLDEPEVSFTCLHIHCASVYCASFNSGGNLLATGSNDQIVHVIEYNSTQHVPVGKEYKLSMHNGTIRDVCFLHDSSPEAASSRLLSAGAGDFSIYQTDCKVMKPTRTYKGHESTVMSLGSCKESPDLFVSCGLDGTIRLWDVRSREAISTIRAKLKGPDQASAQTHLAATVDGDTSFDMPNRTRILSGGSLESSTVGVQECKRDQENKCPQNALEGARRQAQQAMEGVGDDALQFQQDGGSTDGSDIPVGVVRLDPSGRLLVSGHKDGSCMLYDIRAGKIIQLFQAHDDEIRTLEFSPNSYYLLSGSYDKKVKLTDLQGELAQALPCVVVAELDNKVVRVAWHPLDYNFVTACADGTVTLWMVPDLVGDTR